MRLTPSKLTRGIAQGCMYAAGVGLGLLVVVVVVALAARPQHTISSCGELSRGECDRNGRR